MKYLIIAGIVLLAFSQSGCYYDNSDQLFPVAPCDTTLVTYSGTINPILTANCTGCHSGSNPPNGIRLDIYPTVRGVVQSPGGLFLGVIRHTTGFDPMPKNGNKLSDCNITKIVNWVNAGAPNN